MIKQAIWKLCILIHGYSHDNPIYPKHIWGQGVFGMFVYEYVVGHIVKWRTLKGTPFQKRPHLGYQWTHKIAITQLRMR